MFGRHQDKKLVQLSLVTLVLALVFVYRVRREIDGQRLPPATASTEPQIQEITPQTSPQNSHPKSDQNFEKNSDQNFDEKNLEKNFEENSLPQFEEIPAQKENPAIPDLILLSGTEIVYTPLEIPQQLGIIPKFSLKDSNNIFFALLGENPPDLSGVETVFDGSLYTMDTLEEITQNKLFGERIQFINLPENKNLLVLMIVEFQGDYRFIQVPFSIYHRSKNYLKNLFFDAYNGR